MKTRIQRLALLAPLMATVAASACADGNPASGPPPAVETTEESPGAAPQELEQTLAAQSDPAALGREIAMPTRLADGDEYTLSTRALLRHGKLLFTAVWTPQEGGGRPLSKGTGDPVADPTDPLIFPRNFNRISAMDSNGCVSCHNAPVTGAGGHFVTNAFIPGQRFDFATFDHADPIKTKGTFDERGVATTLITSGTGKNGLTTSTSTLGMMGSGYIEMLARQITVDLQRARDATPPGAARPLVSKGVDYGRIKRRADGTWDTSEVSGISGKSLKSTGAGDPPTLVIRPFHQQSVVVSLREFTNNAFNHHHGMQSTERFGKDADPDGDGFTNEMSRAEVTATSLFQATLAVPGRVIPDDRTVERAVWNGEQRFEQIGCTSCHKTSLPLDDRAWIFTEPNPFNPPKNLRPGDAPPVAVDLASPALPQPRLTPTNGVVRVPAYTDLKIHDITTGPTDPNCDPIDMHEDATISTTPGAPANPKFFAGRCGFLTKKLWGAANEPPFFHHGKFTTLREAIVAHAGEAQAATTQFHALGPYDQASIIEFLKTLQTLPAGTRHLVIDEKGRRKQWPPR